MVSTTTLAVIFIGAGLVLIAIISAARSGYGRTTNPRPPGVDRSQPAPPGELVPALTHYGLLEIAGGLALLCLGSFVALIVRALR